MLDSDGRGGRLLVGPMSALPRSRRLLSTLGALLGVLLCWSLLAPELAPATRSELAASNRAPSPSGDHRPTELGPSPSEASEGDPEIEDAFVHGYTLVASGSSFIGALTCIVAHRDEHDRSTRGHDLLARERGPPIG